MENNISILRKAKKLTLRQLASLTGLSVGYLCHLEKGTRSNPSMNAMTKICIALDSSLEEVFHI